MPPSTPRAYLADESADWDGIRLVLLVNRGTASSAEVIAGALQDHDRAAIVGTPTYGKGVLQTTYPLGEEVALKLTTAQVVHAERPLGPAPAGRGGGRGGQPDPRAQPEVFRTSAGRPDPRPERHPARSDGAVFPALRRRAGAATPRWATTSSGSGGVLSAYAAELRADGSVTDEIVPGDARRCGKSSTRGWWRKEWR